MRMLSYVNGVNEKSVGLEGGKRALFFCNDSFEEQAINSGSHQMYHWHNRWKSDIRKEDFSRAGRLNQDDKMIHKGYSHQ